MIKKIAVSIEESAEMSVESILKNTCLVCIHKDRCGLKYKGVCKIARRIRIKIYGGSKAPFTSVMDDDTQLIPVQE